MTIISTARAEGIEAGFMYHYETGAPAADRELLGITTHRVGGGVVLSMRNDVTSYWNKALGFGFTEPVTADLIDEIIGIYRAERAPVAVLQIAPEVLPADWADICAAHGLQPGGRIAKLAAPIEDVVIKGKTDLGIVPVTADLAEAWGRSILTAFGMPHDGLVGMLKASAENPDFHLYAALSGNTVVGGGALYVNGEVASLNSGAVLPGYRRRGGQGALIAARLVQARALGCRYVVTEVVQPDEGQVNPSLNNMLGAGLTRLYVRQNWYWRP